MASKFRSYDQAAAAQQKAIRFASDVLRDADLASDIAAESVEDYAQRKGLILTNSPQRRVTNVANGDVTKNDMQDAIDQAVDILTEAYVPESSREDLVSAVADALDALQGDDSDGDDEDQAAEDDDDDGSDAV